MLKKWEQPMRLDREVAVRRLYPVVFGETMDRSGKAFSAPMTTYVLYHGV